MSRRVTVRCLGGIPSSGIRAGSSLHVAPGLRGRQRSGTIFSRPDCHSLCSASAENTRLSPQFSRRASSSATTQSAPADAVRGKKPSRRKWALLLAGICALSGLALVPEERRLGLLFGKPLNPVTFVPFRVVAREQVSPTSFILTLRPFWSLGPRRREPGDDDGSAAIADPFSTGSSLPPLLFALLAAALNASREEGQRHRHPNRAVVARAWAHGLWSVEVKQPQLQIARDYTPLPPRGGGDAEAAELEAGDLRLLVRRYEGGEVSTYLSRLAVGDEVELRGPHYKFDVAGRLGEDGGKVVFLAGGTGIAPAMQAVHKLLSSKGTPETGDESGAPTVSILWANRRREDCVGCGDAVSSAFWSSKGASGPAQDGELAGPIVQQLREMEQRYTGLLSIKCLVDEERKFIGAKDIMKAVENGHGVFSPRGSSTVVAESGNCPLHSQRVTELSTDEDDPQQVRCLCTGEQPGASSRAGKNLIMVSGPDGFIQAYAGAKRWTDGHELQGPVKGVVGDLKAKYPDVLRDWIVLKL